MREDEDGPPSQELVAFERTGPLPPGASVWVDLRLRLRHWAAPEWRRLLLLQQQRQQQARAAAASGGKAAAERGREEDESSHADARLRLQQLVEGHLPVLQVGGQGTAPRAP